MPLTRTISRVGIFDTDGSEASAGGTHGLSLLGPAGGPYAELHNEVETEGSKVVEEEGTKIVGGSRDLSHVVLESLDHALVGRVPGLAQQDAGSHALYEWADGEFSLASVGPEGAPLRCGAWLGQSSAPGTRRNAVSANGSRAFFTAPDPYAVDDGPGCWGGSASPQSNSPQLYMRAAGQTLELSAPEAGVTDPTGRYQGTALYVGASEDGSKVFFITDGELTAEAVALKLHGPELYECEITEESGGEPACKLTRISAGEEGSPAREPGSSGAQVYTVPAIAADGSAVYFTAFGALAPGASTLKEESGSAPINLYRYDTETARTTFVATVSVLDYPEDYVLAWSNYGMGVDQGGAALATSANWYTTPEGRYLLFAARSEPTGYSTASAGHACPIYDDQRSRNIGHCSEVYRYDSDLPVSEGKPGVPDNPLCVSCDRSGASPVSNAFFATTAAS